MTASRRRPCATPAVPRPSPLKGLQTTKAAINQSAEIAGMRSAITYGVEVGGILDSAETEQYRQFEAVKKEKGLSAAIRWRESQFE